MILMNKIHQMHDKLFNKTFTDPENIKTFLQTALPDTVKKVMDFSSIRIDLTSFVPPDLHEYFSDMIARTTINLQNPDQQPELPADIYILFTHQPIEKNKIFLQFFNYMHLMWQEDTRENNPLRVVIPLVLYHGSEKWEQDGSSAETLTGQFNLPPDVSRYVPNLNYVFFDISQWNLTNPENHRLKENIFLMSALLLLKSGFKKDTEAVEEIFRFWQEKGFSRETVKMIFFLSYISGAKQACPDTLKTLWAEGQSMPEDSDEARASAYRWLSRGQREGIKKGITEGKRQTALHMMRDGMPSHLISRYTGLTLSDIKKLSD